MKTSERKRAKWEQEVAAFRASGQTQAAYARRRGLSQGTLSYWVRKIAEEDASEPLPAFVPVEVRPDPAYGWRPSGGSEGVGCPVAVLTCGGAELVIDAAVSPEWVAALMREVGRC